MEKWDVIVFETENMFQGSSDRLISTFLFMRQVIQGVTGEYARVRLSRTRGRRVHSFGSSFE